MVAHNERTAGAATVNVATRKSAMADTAQLSPCTSLRKVVVIGKLQNRGKHSNNVPLPTIAALTMISPEYMTLSLGHKILMRAPT